MATTDPDSDAFSRLQNVEISLAQMTTKLDVLSATLDAILKRIPAIELTPADPADPAPSIEGIPTRDARAGNPGEATSAVPLPRRPRIKPATPGEFNGDRTKGRAFLNTCLLYMQLCQDEFPDAGARIHWILSYMKTDRAATWADRIIRFESTHTKPRFATWDDFIGEFHATFFPENEATEALMKLESDRYFQRRQTVDTYVDEFEDLIALSGYSDALAIVIKFRRGLNPTIQDKIAEMGQDRPGDRDPRGWYTAARRFDQNRRANEAFNSASTRRTTGTMPQLTASVVPRPTPPPTRNAWPRVPVASPPMSANPPTNRNIGKPLPPGVPMDIDAAKRRGNVPGSCYRCGELGHHSRECPHPFDIRAMSADQSMLLF
jgi:hypothetical protein